MAYIQVMESESKSALTKVLGADGIVRLSPQSPLFPLPQEPKKALPASTP